MYSALTVSKYFMRLGISKKWQVHSKNETIVYIPPIQDHFSPVLELLRSTVQIPSSRDTTKTGCKAFRACSLPVDAIGFIPLFLLINVIVLSFFLLFRFGDGRVAKLGRRVRYLRPFFRFTRFSVVLSFKAM